MRSEHSGTEARAFDSIASGYDAWHATPLGRLVDRLEKEAVLGLVGARAEGVALALSCGTGNDALALAARARGFEAHGWRTAVHFLPLCRERGLDWLERWEAMGARCMPALAAFVAVAARRL